MAHPGTQLFALVDVNNMYVSCERTLAPRLRDRPVVVLSNNDGRAVARSNEVKALGVKMGPPGSSCAIWRAGTASSGSRRITYCTATGQTAS